MTGVVGSFGVLAAVIGLGYVLARLQVLGPDAPRLLSSLTFLVATPALLLTTLASSDLRGVLTSALLVSAASALCVAGIYASVAWWRWRRSVTELTVGALAASYVNAANLGIPVAVYVLGDAALVAPVMLYQLLVITPIAVTVLDTSTADRSASVLRLLAQPLRTPLTISCAVGLLLGMMGWQLPATVLRPFELVGAMAVPGALLAFGMSLRGADRPGAAGNRPELYLVVLLKNVVQPCVAYALGRFVLHMESSALLAVTLMAALPTAQNVFVYATHFARAAPLARDAVLLTTVGAAPVLIAVLALA